MDDGFLGKLMSVEISGRDWERHDDGGDQAGAEQVCRGADGPAGGGVEIEMGGIVMRWECHGGPKHTD
jgi:hypothetical protein